MSASAGGNKKHVILLFAGIAMAVLCSLAVYASCFGCMAGRITVGQAFAQMTLGLIAVLVASAVSGYSISALFHMKKVLPVGVGIVLTALLAFLCVWLTGWTIQRVQDAIFDLDGTLIAETCLAGSVGLALIGIAAGLCAWQFKRTSHKESEKADLEVHSCSIQRTYSKVVSALLAFFLGTMGAHRYYLGYKKQGITQTCGFVSLCIGWGTYIPAMLNESTGVLLFSALFALYGAGVSIWAFVDFIRILIGSLAPADGSGYTENRPMQVQMIPPA